MTPLIFFAGMLIFFWVLVVLPQRRRRSRQTQLLDHLEEGDEVMTVGGLFGFVREVGDNHVVLEIAPDTRVRLAKSAVTARAQPEPEATEASETSLP
ncbi:MAG: preprotein translocase subunit YajC [Actinomycetota bacterium]